MADNPEPEPETETEETEEAVPESSSRKWLVVAIAAILSVVIGGGGYYWVASRSAVAEAAEAPREEQPAMPGGIVTLNPFTVNLADREASRFLRITIELEVATAEEATELTVDQVRQTRARAKVLEVLTTRRADDLTTPEGKASLRTELVEALNSAMAPTNVMDVLFTDFVIQF